MIWDKTTFETYYSSNGWPYGIRGADHVPRFHYNWFGQKQSIQNIVNYYLSLPGFAQVSDVVIVGGGYGWVAEALASNGINAISVDTSPYILATKDVSEESELRDYLTAQGFDPDDLTGSGTVQFMSPDDPNAITNPWTHWLRPDGKKTSATVVDEDMSTTGSRNNIKNAVGGKIDAIVSEFVIESVDAGDDTASLTIIERCQQLRPNPSVSVIHMIQNSNTSHPTLNLKSAQEWRTLLDTNGFTNHYLYDAATNSIVTSGG